MFSNIELPLGYNTMVLEQVLERTEGEIAKNVWKNSKILDFRHFLGGLMELVNNIAQRREWELS